MQLARRIPPLTTGAWLRFDAIRHAVRTAQPRTVLEIGAGVGGLATWLARHYDYTGIEPNDESRTATAARLEVVGAGKVLPSFDDVRDKRFDAVCAFEVLEHIEDDSLALSEWHGFVRDGGALLLSVPAHSERYNTHDELAGHFRRYDRDVLSRRLRDAGFEVNEIYSYGAVGGQALERLRNARARKHDLNRTLQERTSESGHIFQPQSDPVALGCAAFGAPLRLIQRPFRDSDVGIGYVAFARRSP